MLATTEENNGYCIFQGQLMCQVEMMRGLFCKNVNLHLYNNYLYLAHNIPN